MSPLLPASSRSPAAAARQQRQAIPPSPLHTATPLAWRLPLLPALLASILAIFLLPPLPAPAQTSGPTHTRTVDLNNDIHIAQPLTLLQAAGANLRLDLLQAGRPYRDLTGWSATLRYGTSLTAGAYVTVTNTTINVRDGALTFHLTPTDTNTNGTFAAVVLLYDADTTPYWSGQLDLTIRPTTATGSADALALLAPLDAAALTNLNAATAFNPATLIPTNNLPPEALSSAIADGDKVGVTVSDSGATWIPKPALPGYIFVGQSNMDGYMQSGFTVPGSVSNSNANIHYKWYVRTVTGPTNDYMRVIWPVTNGTFGAWGPELSASHALLEQNDGDPIVVIKVSGSGYNMHTQFQPPSGHVYEVLKARIDAANAHYPDLYGRPIDWRALYLFQGEADAAAEATADAWGSNFSNFLAQVRTDVGVPDLPATVAVVYSTDTGTYPYIANVRAQQIAGDWDWFDTRYLRRDDGTHMTPPAYVQVGRMFAGADRQSTQFAIDAEGKGYLGTILEEFRVDRIRAQSGVGSWIDINSTYIDIGLENNSRIRINAADTVVNETGLDRDFRVEGDTDANLIVADGGTDRVGIGVAAPTTKLDVDGTVNATGYTGPADAMGITFTGTNSTPTAATVLGHIQGIDAALGDIDVDGYIEEASGNATNLTVDTMLTLTGSGESTGESHPLRMQIEHDFSPGTFRNVDIQAYIDDIGEPPRLYVTTNATFSTSNPRVLLTTDEGPANGIDADTLDGYHAAALLAGTNITSAGVAEGWVLTAHGPGGAEWAEPAGGGSVWTNLAAGTGIGYDAPATGAEVALLLETETGPVLTITGSGNQTINGNLTMSSGKIITADRININQLLSMSSFWGGIKIGSDDQYAFSSVASPAYNSNFDVAIGRSAANTIRIAGSTGQTSGQIDGTAPGHLLVTGTIGTQELSADPADPAEGTHVIWQSDGTGAGDDGDIMMKITAGGVTKTTTLVDFSAIP
jgi:hypothetical protein